MIPRTFTVFDSFLGQIDKAIRVLAAPAHAGRAFPSDSKGELVLDEAAAKVSTRLMRVNHAGEIAAQGLYQGQAVTARDPQVANAMQHAAVEEMDHLAWCAQRISELNGRTSLLNPLWYAGSFALGALAGALGDKTSLGFIAETERQVESHLNGHLDRLPAADLRSRSIILQMRNDEAVHGATATAMGGNDLPLPLSLAMRLVSRVMTFSSYWL